MLTLSLCLPLPPSPPCCPSSSTSPYAPHSLPPPPAGLAALQQQQQPLLAPALQQCAAKLEAPLGLGTLDLDLPVSGLGCG